MSQDLKALGTASAASSSSEKKTLFKAKKYKQLQRKSPNRYCYQITVIPLQPSKSILNSSFLLSVLSFAIIYVDYVAFFHFELKKSLK